MKVEGPRKSRIVEREQMKTCSVETRRKGDTSEVIGEEAEILGRPVSGREYKI